MADNLGPILPMPGMEPALPTDGTLPGDATAGGQTGDTQPTADPPGRGTDSTADHLQTDVGAASDRGHNWNMDPPGSEVDATVREA